MGLSWGAVIALDFALEHPERVSSLTLIGPGLSGYALPSSYVEKVSSIFSIALTGDYEDFVSAYLDDPSLAPRPDRVEARELVRELLQENRRMFEVDPTLAQSPSPPANGRLSTVRAPAHIIVGDRQDVEIVRIARLLASEIEDSEITELDGCGHMANLDEPELFNDSVIQFIARRDRQ